MPAIVGTFYLTLGTAIFSVPLGVAAAIYLSEYASENWLTRIIRIAIINLSGIPSVVYGLFGLGLFVLFLELWHKHSLGFADAFDHDPAGDHFSTAEEALRAVPQSFRTVSISLGATRWQTIRRIVLPEALPGIITGVILGLERAAGETAPILFTGAAFFLPRLPNSVFRCDDGPALSPVCHLDPGARNAVPDSIRHGAGADRLRAGHEHHRDGDPFEGQGAETVVIRGRWTIDRRPPFIVHRGVTNVL